MLFINLEFKTPANDVVTDVFSVLRKVEMCALLIVCFLLGGYFLLDIRCLVRFYVSHIVFRHSLGFHRKLLVLADTGSRRLQIADGDYDYCRGYRGDSLVGHVGTNHKAPRSRQRPIHRVHFLRYTSDRVFSYLQPLAGTHIRGHGKHHLVPQLHGSRHLCCKTVDCHH